MSDGGSWPTQGVVGLGLEVEAHPVQLKASAPSKIAALDSPDRGGRPWLLIQGIEGAQSPV